MTVSSVAARITITVPARWRVTDQVLVVGARQAMADRDSGRDGSPREPLRRLRGTCLGGSLRLTQG